MLPYIGEGIIEILLACIENGDSIFAGSGELASAKGENGTETLNGSVTRGPLNSPSGGCHRDEIPTVADNCQISPEADRRSPAPADSRPSNKQTT
jgi:hypothetical protein